MLSPVKLTGVVFKCILKYLKGASHLVVCFGGFRMIHSFIVYCDVDYVVDLDDRKSRNGYVLFLNNGPMS
jgi:hypothetical protein